MKRIILSFLILPPLLLHPQTPGRKADWFPRGNLYPTIRLDYTESQISGSLYFFHAERGWQNRGFGMFSVGLRYNVIRWQHAPERASELGFELAAFSQFIFEDPFGDFQTNLFNVEFKVGVHYQYRIRDWRFRGRVYHISTHLGDDYIFRYGILGFINNPRIYEVVDLSACWARGGWNLYATAGAVFHSAYARTPLLAQGGVQFVHPVGKMKWIRWVAGTDIRVEQAQGFRPGIHAGAGIGMGPGGRFPVTLMADYYYGYMPYSLYDHLLIQWIGATIYFNPF